jgi:hypothetical protein
MGKCGKTDLQNLEDFLAYDARTEKGDRQAYLVPRGRGFAVDLRESSGALTRLSFASVPRLSACLQHRFRWFADLDEKQRALWGGTPAYGEATLAAALVRTERLTPRQALARFPMEVLLAPQAKDRDVIREIMRQVEPEDLPEFRGTLFLRLDREARSAGPDFRLVLARTATAYQDGTPEGWPDFSGLLLEWLMRDPEALDRAVRGREGLRKVTVLWKKLPLRQALWEALATNLMTRGRLRSGEGEGPEADFLLRVLASPGLKALNRGLDETLERGAYTGPTLEIALGRRGYPPVPEARLRLRAGAALETGEGAPGPEPLL